MLFLTFWIVLFAWLFKISGSDVEMDSDKTDYANLQGNVIQVVESFRNTLGDD